MTTSLAGLAWWRRRWPGGRGGGAARAGRAVVDRRSDRLRRPRVARARLLESIAVQASLIAAGSLDADVVRAAVPSTRGWRQRYLAVEGHRALVANDDLLPGVLRALADPAIAAPQ